MNLESAKKNVLSALENFRTALRECQSIAREMPRFIMDKAPCEIDQRALEDCKVFNGRLSLLEYLPSGGILAEVGTWRGDFSREILDRKNPRELHLFDNSFNVLREDVSSDPRIRKIKGNSAISMSGRPDKNYDWIYIDADHTYAGVERDINASVEKLKDGGIMIFNDYVNWSPMEAQPYGVVAAVNELINRGGWIVVGLGLTPHGYWDIALQKANVNFIV